MKCVKCQKTIRMGENAIGVQRGVLGSRGLVPLEPFEVYCSEECIKKNFDDFSPPEEEERIP